MITFAVSSVASTTTELTRLGKMCWNIARTCEPPRARSAVT